MQAKCLRRKMGAPQARNLYNLQIRHRQQYRRRARRIARIVLFVRIVSRRQQRTRTTFQMAVAEVQRRRAGLRRHNAPLRPVRCHYAALHIEGSTTSCHSCCSYFLFVADLYLLGADSHRLSSTLCRSERGGRHLALQRLPINCSLASQLRAWIW